MGLLLYKDLKQQQEEDDVVFPFFFLLEKKKETGQDRTTGSHLSQWPHPAYCIGIVCSRHLCSSSKRRVPPPPLLSQLSILLTQQADLCVDPVERERARVSLLCVQ